MSHVLDAVQTLQVFLTADRVIAILTLVAACWAVRMAYLAPTRKDMRRVEEHVAATLQHLNRQARREELNNRANRKSISIRGKNPLDEPLIVTIVVGDPTVRLTRVELCDESGTVYGTSETFPMDTKTYNAPINSGDIQRLSKSAGFRGWSRIRVYMLIEQEEAHREMPVRVSQVQMRTDLQDANSVVLGWLIEGEV